jgi:hypothetical protein
MLALSNLENVLTQTGGMFIVGDGRSWSSINALPGDGLSMRNRHGCRNANKEISILLFCGIFHPGRCFRAADA